MNPYLKYVTPDGQLPSKNNAGKNKADDIDDQDDQAVQ